MDRLLDHALDDNLARHELVRLEGLIEKLNDQLAWCAKISVAAKVTIAVGALWFALALVGILPFGATAFVGTITAVLGGVVLLGSNATTWDQTTVTLRETEAARAALIGQLRLRLVSDDGARTLH